MRFVLLMARREIRSSWRRLIFFFLCIAIGVGAIVAVRSVIRNFNHVFTSDARAILGADIQIESIRPWGPESLATINRVAVESRVETTELATMLRPAEASKEGAILVELKGIDPLYPFYGEITLADGQRYNDALLADHGALLARAVLERLNLRIGEEIKIGNSAFTIRGVLDREPGSVGHFRFGPRVIIAREALEAAGLTEFGSRARRKILLKVAEPQIERVTSRLRSALKSNLIEVRSYKESQENINQQFTRAENFLSLTGLIILVLGGIGISSVTRVFIEQKKKSIAVLKCLGAGGRKILSAYLTQMTALGLFGSLVGVALAKGAIYFVALRYASTLPSNMTYALQLNAILQGLGFGILVSILFSVLPLLRIRHIKPNVLLREETEVARHRFDPLRWITAALVTLGLVLLASWQAASLRVGVFFLAGLLIAAGALHLGSWILIRLVRRARALASFPLRYSISGLHRPGNQTNVIIMAVGLGSFFIVATDSIQFNLLEELDFSRRINMADMYLIDIQNDQREGVAKIVHDATKQNPNLIPTVRARIFAINGKPLDSESEEYKRDRDRLGYEYTLTYRYTLNPTETVTAGKFWGHTPASSPEISIEDGMRGMMGLDLGGTITFDILGRRITARVTSIRHVDWNNSRTDFYILFRPGTLENAPNVYIAGINAPTNESARAHFQRALADRYPNVTAIDVNDIVAGVRRIMDNVKLAVSFIGGFVFFSGVLILIGSIAMTKFQRIYEAAVLKTLGAKRKTLLTILTIEYGLLGCVAGIVSALAAMGLSYAVSRHVFEIPWSWTPRIYCTGIAATAVLVLLVGALSSLDVLNRKPLSTLRTQ